MQVFGTAGESRPGPQAVSGRVKRILIAATLGVYFVFGYFAAIRTHNGVGLGDAPLFYDFSAFYQAGKLADSGRAVAAYDDNTMIAAERAAFPGATARLPWNYPPSFQLMLMPLALLPYVAAWLLWSGGLYGVFALLARKLVGAKHLWLLLLAPGAAVNLFVGQNGLLSTALMGGGVLMLGRRPIVGGALLGLMTYKPQFALLVPLVLICGREWRALASAVVSGAALALLAAAVLGVDPWLAFLHKAAQPAAIFSSSSSDWRSIPSVMIMARSLGLGAGLSAAIHWCVAIAAAIGALWIWRRTSDLRIRAGALAAATLLVTPYLRAYDLVLLILPIAVLLTNAEGKLGLGEMIAVFAAWVLPAVLLFSSPPVQLGPVVSVALMGLMLWQVARPKTIGHGIDGALGSRPRETQPASSS